MEKNTFFQSLINHAMREGKKSKAHSKILKSLQILRGEQKKTAIFFFQKVFLILRPLVEVRNVRVRRSSYTVPFPTSKNRQIHLVCLWLLQTISKDKRKISFEKKLAHELTEVLRGRGETLKKKISVYQMAKKNRSNMHYRWY